jgi:signal transduction histidine kinase
VHTRCFTRDITERKRAAEILEQMVAERTGQLRETVAQLEAFSYSISHDLRAPLRTMHGYAKALLEDYRGQLNQEAVDYLDRIDKAATRLDRLIRDILAFSKIANGQVELKPVSLTSLLENLMQQHPGFAEARGSILAQLPLQPVLGHETYLTQCLTNLIENALKFVPMGTQPQVVIQTEMIGDKVRISVSDNGIGIDPEQHAKLFHVFGRAHVDKRFPGTGIGLAIVKKAAERMGGKVGLDSETGRGSTFWIELKAAIAN